MDRIENFKSIMDHRRAYLQVAKELNVMKIRFYFHDLEKAILLLFIGDSKATNIHRKISRHHIQNGYIKDPLGAVIDWECARYTKADKQMTARQTMNKYYSGCSDQIIPILKELGL